MAKRGRKQKSDLSHLTCPNPQCPDLGKAGPSAIVANGTYAKKGGRGQRFRCRTCGKSFCQKTEKLFAGLHYPEEKVILALKLLVKGLTIRKTSAMLKVRPDTLRRWLSRLAKNPAAVNERLRREPGVTEAELNSLWTAVREGSLKKRAILWRQRIGWRPGWTSP